MGLPEWPATATRRELFAAGTMRSTYPMLECSDKHFGLMAMTPALSIYRKWAQFRLRTILALMVVVGIGLAWLSHERRRIQECHVWLESLHESWWNVARDDKLPAQPAWSKVLFGQDPNANVIGLNLTSSNIKDMDLSYLRNMKHLDWLVINDPHITDEGISHIAYLKNLRSLDLENTKLSDSGLYQLSVLVKLEHLSLKNSRITDAGLRHLAMMSKLQRLSLRGTSISDSGLRRVETLGNIKHLDISNTNVTMSGYKKTCEALPNSFIYYTDGNKESP